MKTYDTNQVVSNRLPFVPRMHIRTSGMTMQLVPDTDAGFKVKQPLRWVLPGLGARKASGRGYDYFTATTGEVQRLARRRGFTAVVLDTPAPIR